MAMCLILAIARLLLNRLQESVQLAGVVAEDLALDGRADRAEVLGDPLLRVGPDAVGMRVVRAPHDVVLADERDHHRDRGLVLIGRIALPAPQLARLHREVELVVAVLVPLVHPVEDVRQPAHAGLAEHELETREAIESAREHYARQKLGGGDLEHGRAGGAVAEVVLLLHRIVGRLANGIARRVERDRHATFLSGFPQRIPRPMPDGKRGSGHGEVGALETEPRRTPELRRRRHRIVVRNAREPDEAPGIGLAEVGGPAVVDLVDRLDELAVLHAQADPEDSVHHLGVDAVEVLILQTQIRRGRVRAALIEADLEHLLDVLRESALDSVEAEAESAEDTQFLFLGIPARSVVGLPHLGHPIAEPGGGVLDPEVAGHPGHIDVAVGGDDAIAHGLTSLESETVSVRTFTLMARRQGSATERHGSRRPSNVWLTSRRFRIGWIWRTHDHPGIETGPRRVRAGSSHARVARLSRRPRADPPVAVVVLPPDRRGRPRADSRERWR